MTMPEQDYASWMTAEGEVYAPQTLDAPGFEPQNIPFVDGAVLPDKATLEKVENAVRSHLWQSETARKEHVERVTGDWARYNQIPYENSDMLLAEEISIVSPLIRSRVNNAHGSLYEALDLEPFYAAQVDDGSDNRVAVHAEAAIGEELARAVFSARFSKSLKHSLVGGIGFLKFTVVAGPDGSPRLDIDAVGLRDMYLSPHNVRDLAECAMVAQRYMGTLGWLRDQALEGYFDRKAVDHLGADSRDVFDENSTDRDGHGLSGHEGEVMDEAAWVELLEAYVRVRLDPGVPSELWRVVVAKKGRVVLRAERWTDGLPFAPLRHEYSGDSVYCVSFPEVLRDTQYMTDQLLSGELEMNRAAVTPAFEYDELNSSTTEWIRKRQRDVKGSVRPKAGDLIPRRGPQPAFTPIYFQPAPMNIESTLNRLESMASNATIPSYPAQTYRTATEHKYAYASVSRMENQMLKVLRADLTHAADLVKRLYWTYIAKPVSDGMKEIRHGSVGYYVSESQWASLSLTPRGMTSLADQMGQAQAAQEALTLITQLLPQKPAFVQIGEWPAVWEAMRMLFEAMGVREYQKLIGPPPVNDPNLVQYDSLSPTTQNALMMLMNANSNMGGGLNPAAPSGPDQGTVPPGGAPQPAEGGLN